MLKPFCPLFQVSKSLPDELFRQLQKSNKKRHRSRQRWLDRWAKLRNVCRITAAFRHSTEDRIHSPSSPPTLKKPQTRHLLALRRASSLSRTNLYEKERCNAEEQGCFASGSNSVLSREEEELRHRLCLLSPSDTKVQAQFEIFMTSKVGRQAFLEFLESEFSDENLLFWMACEDYKHVSGGTEFANKRKILGTEIFESFISSSSSMEVNLNASVKNAISERVISAHFGPDLLLEAQNQVYQLMERDSFIRFLNSRFAKRYFGSTQWSVSTASPFLLSPDSEDQQNTTITVPQNHNTSVLNSQ